MRVILIFNILLLALLDLAAQQNGPGRNLQERGDAIKMQFPDTEIETILRLYETLTDRSIIQGPKSKGQLISLISSAEMPPNEAAEYIEISLLQHGYAIVPTQNPKYWKLVSSVDANIISSEFIPIIKNSLDVPASEEVITYITQLRHTPPEEAAEALKEIVTLHPFGRIVPMRSSKSLIITESGSTVRRILDLLEEIDLRVEPTIDRLFVLERATAEDVTTALSEIYSNQSSSSSATPNRPLVPTPRNGQPQAKGNVVRTSTSRPTGGNVNAPLFQAISRSNSVLVVSTPDDMVVIERLIGYLDAPAELANFIKIQLNYLTVSQFLAIAGDSLSRGLTETNGQVSGGDRTPPNNQQTNTNQFTNTNPLNNNTSQVSASASLGSLTENQQVGPQSLVVGKTLLVADNDHNVLIASGPPEDLFLIEELVEVMDVRPDQIQISAVIAQLTLNDDFNFGIDFLRTLPEDVTGFDSAGLFRTRRTGSGAVLDVDSLTDAATAVSAVTPGLNMFGRFNSNLDGFISTLESTNRFKVLSRPTVYTVNNRRAVIQTGQRIAVPRSTLSSINQNGNNSNNQIVTANIDFENVLLKVEVIPLINNDGQITLRINQSNDDIVGSQTIGGDEIPTIGTQALGTTIMVPDGKTVMLGGLISEEDKRDESGLPVFGNIPLLGRVLGSRGDNVSRQELLIFIQPKVIKSDSQYYLADQDMIDRTRIGEDTVKFSEGEVNNLPSFESREFQSPEKRMQGVKNFFQRLKGKSHKKGPNGESPELPKFDRP